MGVCSRSARSNARAAELEAFARILGEEQDVLGVAVGRVGGEKDVGLLRAGRHARGGSAPLHVEDHRRDLGEIGETQELLHQGDAGSRGGREGPRAVPGGADHHADRSQLVLGLHDGVAALSGLRIGAEAAAVLGERLGERGRGRDRIPGRDRRAAVHGSERRGVVSFEEDAVADRVGAADLQSDAPFQVRFGIVAAQMQGLVVGRDELVLAAELLRDETLHLGDLDSEQGCERAHVDDVLEQLPLPRIGVSLVANGRERHADHVDVASESRRRHRPGRIVEQVASRLDLVDVAVPGLRVHRDHEVDAAPASPVARLRDPDLEPGRKALNVGRKDVPRGDRHAHPQERAGEQPVGARRTRAVDVGELDDEVVRRL